MSTARSINRLWAQDGMLMGARFDGAIDTTTDFNLGTIALPVLSQDDPDTTANELRTHLVLTGNAVDGNEGMFSMGALLGDGMATNEGPRFIDGAVETISKVRSDVAALLSLETPPGNLDGPTGILENQWTKLEAALDRVFNTSSADATSPTSAVRQSHPRQADILDEIDDILDALASEDAFVAATAAGGGGVFESQELGAGAASDAFNRVEWTAMATMGATGATRYGTGLRKTTANARTGLSNAEVGAFSYSTMGETVRTSQAAAISLTGIASYTGGTEAISGGGTTYSGTMDVQVRFAANSVSGVVSGLTDADGLPWQHNSADVDRIVLDNAPLRRDAQWNDSGITGVVFYTADSGLLRPFPNLTNTFRGILLGTGDDAGSQASGVWSVNASTSSNYLTGGFGVMHVGDTTRPRPGGDSGGASNATLMTSAALPTNGSVAVAGGNLTVKLQRFGWVVDGTATPRDLDYQGLVDDMGTPDDVADDAPVLITAEFDLEALAANGAGATTTVNGPKWADSVKTIVQSQRDQIAILQSLGTRNAATRAEEATAWQTAVDAIQYQLFGGDLPMQLSAGYAEDDAIGLLDRVLDALANTTNLFAATDPSGTGIFDHYDSNADGNADDVADDDITDYITYDSGTDRRWEFLENNRTLSAFLGEREHKVVASLGTTDYGRFGAWYRIGAASAQRNGRADTGDDENKGVTTGEGGPGSFAYSPLDPTMAGTVTNPAFPLGGSATYHGETVAIMGTTMLTGTARVDVSWASVGDPNNITPADLDLSVSADGTTDTASRAGIMSVTLGSLADSTGDPLTYFVPGAGTGAGQEIAEIVFDGMFIEVGLPGARSGSLIVGNETGGAPDPDGNVEFTYAEISLAPATDVRYRLADIGTSDQAGSGTASVGALFVGQGVDGPLGVIGTWSLTDPNVARVHATGSQVEAGGTAIHGGFGADLP